LDTILAPSPDRLELHLGEGQSAAAILALPVTGGVIRIDLRL